MPADLRVCLETCLSEEASTATLERHLPQIRDIIVRLLQGLKTKQAYYKQLQMEQQQPRLPPNVHGSRVPTPGARSASRSESATGASSPRPSATAQVPPRPMPDLRQATGSPRAFSPPPLARPQPPLPSHQQQQHHPFLMILTCRLRPKFFLNHFNIFPVALLTNVLLVSTDFDGFCCCCCCCCTKFDLTLFGVVVTSSNVDDSVTMSDMQLGLPVTEVFRSFIPPDRRLKRQL